MPSARPRGGARLGPDAANAAVEAKRALARLARPSGNFDASRYFRGADDLRFHNVGTTAMRDLARSIHAANASAGDCGCDLRLPTR